MHQLRAIQRTLAAIEAGLTEPLSIGQLARHAGMSLWHFQRTFTAMVGDSIGSYIRRRRLTEAGLRLRSGPATILEVALAYQFESHEAFTRAFKAEFRLTPSAWRRGAGRCPALFPATRITRETLEQRFHPMHLEPEIIDLPARTFAGLSTRFISAMSPTADNLAVIPRLWETFVPRIPELVPLATEAHVTYGLADCPESFGEKPRRPDEVVYLAAIPVRAAGPLPAGMVAWTSPRGTFAKFVHRGPIHGIGKTMGYIYAHWLPTSDYDRSPGPDVERYDHRFQPAGDESVLEIFVPVSRRAKGAKSARIVTRRPATAG